MRRSPAARSLLFFLLRVLRSSSYPCAVLPAASSRAQESACEKTTSRSPVPPSRKQQNAHSLRLEYSTCPRVTPRRQHLAGCRRSAQLQRHGALPRPMPPSRRPLCRPAAALAPRCFRGHSPSGLLSFPRCAPAPHEWRHVACLFALLSQGLAAGAVARAWQQPFLSEDAAQGGCPHVPLPPPL